MDFHQLYVFTKVVEQKSFSKAANVIFLSQSTISSHIQSLEKNLNVKLFDRIGREIILTNDGERLYQWAKKILLLKDEALHDLKEGKTDARGEIKIAASSVPGQFILPKMVKQFSSRYPNVTFHISQAASKLVAEKVLRGQVDFGVLGEKYDNDKLKYIPLLKEKLVIIASNDSELMSPIRLEDVIKFPFIMRNSDSGTNASLEKFLHRREMSTNDLQIVALTDCGHSLIQLVKLGVGISIISEMAAREQAQSVRVVEIDKFDEERYFYLVYHVEKTQSMVSRLFIEMGENFHI